MLDLRSLIGGLPSALQYVIVLGLVMVLLYAALWLTRKIGSRFSDSEKITFDDPEKYAEDVPDLFATTEFRHKNPKGNAKGTSTKAPAASDEGVAQDDVPSVQGSDQDRDQDSDSDQD